jgi:hypothetical protein
MSPGYSQVYLPDRDIARFLGLIQRHTNSQAGVLKIHYLSLANTMGLMQAYAGNHDTAMLTHFAYKSDYFGSPYLQCYYWW